jgi:hypothetical protein
MITGSVASTVYGEPRMTHDIDLVIELSHEDAQRFVDAFPLETFYCPPTEIIKVELGRSFRGHFNLIHHETGFKADVYLSGRDPLHEWALSRKNKIELEGGYVWVAPAEYVILRKLEYYREGKSEKHLRDIHGIFAVSSDAIDFKALETKVAKLGLSQEWQLAKTQE